MNYFRELAARALLALPAPKRQKAPTLHMGYPFPLRRDYVTMFDLPSDLTEEESERVCAFVRAAIGPKQ